MKISIVALGPITVGGPSCNPSCSCWNIRRHRQPESELVRQTLHVVREFKGICPLPPVNTAAKGPTHADGPRGPKKPIWVRRGVEGKGLWSLNKNGDCSTQRLGKRQPKYLDFTSLMKEQDFYDLNMLHTGIQRFNEQKRKRPSCHLPRLAGNSLRIGIGT